MFHAILFGENAEKRSKGETCMRIEYLEYLLEVARSKSISAAAKRLYLSQTSLSAIVNSLEKELNIKIFQRTHKGIVLTAEGEQALELAADIVEKNEQLQHLFSTSRTVRRIINLVVYPSVSNCLSVYLTRELGDEYPEIALHIHEQPYNRIASSVTEGVSKTAIGAETTGSFDPEYEMKNSGFSIEPLYVDRFYAVVSAESPFAARDCVDVDELLGERLAITHCYPSFQDQTVGQVLRRFPRFTVFSNVEASKRAVAENDMISIMPGLALLGDLYENTGLIRRIRVMWFDTRLTNYLLYDDRNGMSAMEHILLGKIRDFYRELQEQLGSDDVGGDDEGGNGGNQEDDAVD